MKQIGVGHGTAWPAIVPIAVSPGQTVKVTNVAGASIGYLLNGINGAQTALAAGNNVSLTAPSWLVPSGVSTVLINGGAYGA